MISWTVAELVGAASVVGSSYALRVGATITECAMDNDEFQRLVLLGLAELVYMVGEFVYGSPYKAIGTPYRQVAAELRTAAREDVTNE